MALLENGRSRAGYLFLALAVGHIILISAQVNTRTGVPMLQAVIFGALAEVQKATSSLVGGVRGAWGGYVDLGEVRGENEALRKELGELRIKLQQARYEAARTAEMRKLLDLRDRSQLPTRAAEIVGTSASGDFKTVTIDRGTDDGVLTDHAVVCPDGAVGRVVMPTRAAAKVQLLTDRSAAAAVMIERSRAQGIVLGSGDELLRLEYLSATADVVNGDIVVTSGIDGIYPPGFVVGKVESIERAGGAFKSIRVRPAVRFSDLESVLVVLASQQETADPAPDARPAQAAGGADAGGRR